MSENLNRRNFMILAGGGLIVATHPLLAQFNADTSGGTPGLPRIRAIGSYGRGIYYFDPAGLWVDVGATVQWAGLGRRVIAAFHPSNDNHELRIPEGAKPFDSRKEGLTNNVFQWKFETEGTYDYFCGPQESLGMVGRIIVGKPGGPAEKPPGYGNRDGRAVMYPRSARLLEYLKPDEIVRKKSIPFPVSMFERAFPAM